MRQYTLGLAALAIVALAASRAVGAEPAPPRPVSAVIDALSHVEAVEMLSAILRGEPIGAGTAWFHPAQTVYDWKWLSAQMDADHDGAVTPEEFKGPRELFDRLDRDRDGRLTAADFDWSDASPYWRQMTTARQLLRRGDADGDGALTAEEWQALFQKTAKGKDKLTADDLRLLLFPAQPKSSGPPSGMPSQAVLLRGFLSNEIGSVCEGPAVGRRAPDFTLRTPDGEELSLHKYRGDRPLVLVFGSFT
ncbi:MAG TPA: hypothetical protein VMS17_13655 [Gemmataceae bacterium]|nr:hypothetical protein [Gemmataceae bacterium]